ICCCRWCPWREDIAQMAVCRANSQSCVAAGRIGLRRQFTELAMSLAALETYGVTAERGFLCPYDAPSVVLDGELAEVRDVALRLPEILPTGKVRAVLEALPPIPAGDIAALDDVQARMAMVHY